MIVKEGVKKIPHISRSGYSLVIDEGYRKVSIYSKYAYAGVFVIEGKVFSIKDYPKFQDAQKALENILNKKSQTSFYNLFFPRAEAQNPAVAVAIITAAVFMLGTVIELMRVFGPEQKDFSNPGCIAELKNMNPDNLPANEQSLQKLIGAYNRKVSDLSLKLRKRPEVIFDHASAVKVLEELKPADCSQIDDSRECEKLKKKYEEGRRQALQELNKASEHRLQSSTANKSSAVSLANAETIKDCLKLYDKYFWEVFSKMPEAERNKVKLYVDVYGYLDMGEKISNKGLKVPPTASTGSK